MPHHLPDLVTAARSAIVTGDPDRVPHLADAIGTTTARWSRRGYLCVEVSTDGGPLLVCSTGIGGPTTAIVVEELAQMGVRQVVRVGTCGSLQQHVRPGDLVISSGAVRDDGTSDHYLPLEFPAVPDSRLLGAIVDAAELSGATYHVGITHCKDAFYVEKPDALPLADEWRTRWAVLRAAGVLATEMEVAALFAVALVRKLRSAGVFVPVDQSISPQLAIEVLQLATRIVAGAALSVATQYPLAPRKA